MKSPLKNGQLLDGWIVDDSEYEEPVPVEHVQPGLGWAWRLAVTIFLFLVLLEVLD